MNSLVLNLAHRVVQRIIDIPRRGLPVLLRKPAELLPDNFDARYGVETSKLVWLTNISSANYAHGIRYEPCPPAGVHWAIKESGIDPAEYWFVDVGCGKGRPLIIASEYAFPHLIGIDYSADLCRQAASNLRKYRVSAERFRIDCADATEYVFPEHNLLLFLYNPFSPVVLRKMMSHLEANRKHLCIAFIGELRYALQEYSWLHLIAQTNDADIYRNQLHRAPKFRG